MSEYYYRYFKDQPVDDTSHVFNAAAIVGEGPLPTHPDYERFTEYVGGYYGNGEYEIAISELDNSIVMEPYSTIVVGSMEGRRSGTRSLFRSAASTLDDRLVSMFSGSTTTPESVFITLPRGRYEPRKNGEYISIHGGDDDNSNNDDQSDEDSNNMHEVSGPDPDSNPPEICDRCPVNDDIDHITLAPPDIDEDRTNVVDLFD